MLEDLFSRFGLTAREGSFPILEADIHAPTGLIQNLETTIQDPLNRNPRVLSAIVRSHRRLQAALARR